MDAVVRGTAQSILGVNRKTRREMNRLYRVILRLAQDERGQDLVEYALLAGFIAVAAGAVLPSISSNISIIFSKMASVVGHAAEQ